VPQAGGSLVPLQLPLASITAGSRQHPRQIFFIFAFSFELSSASMSASGRWLGVLDPEVAWSGVLDPGCLECSATQAGGAWSRQAFRSLAFDIDWHSEVCAIATLESVLSKNRSPMVLILRFSGKKS
jgi:hypothetical protein